MFHRFAISTSVCWFGSIRGSQPMTSFVFALTVPRKYDKQKTHLICHQFQASSSSLALAVAIDWLNARTLTHTHAREWIVRTHMLRPRTVDSINTTQCADRLAHFIGNTSAPSFAVDNVDNAHSSLFCKSHSLSAAAAAFRYTHFPHNNRSINIIRRFYVWLSESKPNVYMNEWIIL